MTLTHVLLEIIPEKRKRKRKGEQPDLVFFLVGIVHFLLHILWPECETLTVFVYFAFRRA